MEYVKIKNVIFTGKQNIKWAEVEKYLKRYVGQCFVVNETKDLIMIGASFPDEYVWSKYTQNLRGGYAKVKANLVQNVEEIIFNAVDRRWIENKSEKHMWEAKNGWYRYNIHISLPVKAENEEEIRLNYYKATLVAKINDKGIYLYDIINIKKEARKP